MCIICFIKKKNKEKPVCSYITCTLDKKVLNGLWC